MNSLDIALTALALTIMCLVSWVSYTVGRDKAGRQASHTISHLRQQLLHSQQRLERTSYELASLRDALRTSKLQGLAKPPAWMEGQDG